MVNNTYNSTKETIIKLKNLKGKTKLKFYKNLCFYYDDMKYKIFQFGQDPFAKNAQGISKIYYEVFLIMKVLQAKPHVKNMNINYWDLCYNVIKNRKEKEKVIDKGNENDDIKYNDFNTPNHFIGSDNFNEMLG